ncbi:MAG: molecular chaperone HtpG [Leptospiraceae bacterium]|nr:molecular chaperone HtpG [Leptospiraceae bacterium]
MQKGKLDVRTENILPIIKKWLYSEKEIFVRELVSNAFDALAKVRKLALSEDIRDADDDDFKIEITTDKEHRQLIIADNGIGLTGEEIRQYIAQIAFSGAEEFAKKYEASGNKNDTGIIGNFGLGFYSAFIVSKRVEIDSLSWQADATAAFWGSDGGEEYDIGAGQRQKRGTTITLHIDDDSDEYLEEARIKDLVKRYSDFLPVAIHVNGEKANKQDALWAKAPSGVKEDEYKEFYNYLYPFQGEPLFHVHLNVDHPFHLKGILYFPRLGHELDLQKSNIKIYCKQVFVTDESQGLVPEFLTALQGVIDLPDLPLNVSRSYLQNEPQIKKIASHVVKKVADRLTSEFKNNRENFEKIWPDISPFVKYGMMNDDKFYEQVLPVLIYPKADGADGSFLSIEDYLAANKDKTNGKIYYATDVNAQAGHLRLLKKEGIDVLVMSHMIDSHFMQFLEGKNQDYKFARVDAEVSEHVMDKDAKNDIVDADGKDDQSALEELFKKALGADGEQIKFRVESLKDDNIPAMILVDEQMRRFSDMAAMMNRSGTGAPPFPRDHTVLLNRKNPIIQSLSKPAIVTGESGESKQELLAKEVYFLARLSQGGVGANELESLLVNSYSLLARLV